MNSTQLGIMRSILAEPDCDTPRMVFADACEESGDVERAEFVRCQLELAKWHFTPGLHQKHCRCDGCDLRRREQSLLIRHKDDWFPLGDVIWQANERNWLGLMQEAGWHRGFLSTIRCDWATWLAHHERLFWYAPLCPECDNKPEKKAGCQTCKGKGTTGQVVPCIDCNRPAYCDKCHDRHRIPRPCPDELAATAQPITRLELTTLDGQEPIDAATMFFTMEDDAGNGYRFDRVKCPTCGGRSGVPVPRTSRLPSYTLCPQCHGTPINSWTCDAWPGLEVILPQTNYVEAAALRDIARAVSVSMAVLGNTFRQIATAGRTAAQAVLDAWPRDADGNLIELVDTEE